MSGAFTGANPRPCCQGHRALRASQAPIEPGAHPVTAGPTRSPVRVQPMISGWRSRGRREHRCCTDPQGQRSALGLDSKP